MVALRKLHSRKHNIRLDKVNARLSAWKSNFVCTWSGAFHASTIEYETYSPDRLSNYALQGTHHSSSTAVFTFFGNSSIGLRMIFFLSRTNLRKQDPLICFLTCPSGKPIFFFSQLGLRDRWLLELSSPCSRLAALLTYHRHNRQLSFITQFKSPLARQQARSIQEVEVEVKKSHYVSRDGVEDQYSGGEWTCSFLVSFGLAMAN